MDSKRYSGRWDQQYPSNRASLGRHPEQDAYASDTSPIIPQYGAPIQARGPPPAVYQPSTGSSRSNSHRRRESHGYVPHEAYQNAVAGPSQARAANGQSYAARLHAQPGLEDQIYHSRTRRPDYDDPVSPASPTDRVAFSKELIGQKMQGRRKGSVPERSPLQKLEVTLDDISKEEKRARVAEAEAMAQDRIARDPRRSSRGSSGPQRYASGPANPYPQPQRAVSGKRVSSAPTAAYGAQPVQPPQGYVPAPAPVQPIQPRQGYVPAPVQPIQPRQGYVPAAATVQPIQPQQGYVPAAKPAQRSLPRQHDGPTDRRSGSGAQNVDWRPSDERHVGRKSYPADAAPAAVPANPSQPLAHSVVPAAATAAAATSAVGWGRSNSKKLQKLPQQNHATTGPLDAGKTQLQEDRMGATSGRAAARTYQAPDPVPPQQVLNRGAAGPKYEIPPQTAAAQAARDQVGFGQAQPQQLAGVAPTQQQQQHHYLGGMLPGHQGPERRYKGTKPLDEWRSAQIAALVGDDLVLDDASSAEKNTAWWEKNEKSRRRSSGSRTVAFDGVVEEAGRQTYFQPPLYLKCGPLLRYCGTTRTQSSRGNTREIWRGSVLIVTDDTQSHTQAAPTLRLFVQPQELLPPPPAELDVMSGQQLAPEYVDPLAGQTHLSRIGKTLYVRPVEQLPINEDLSRLENDNGLFEETRSNLPHSATILNTAANTTGAGRNRKLDGEKVGKFREVKAIRLYSERNTTFWRFNIEVELGRHQTRIAYRINNGPAIGFWVPASGETMNIMFHSCNGFSLSVNPNDFCGPDPMWRDVLNCHQTKPFHVMIGGGDQIYNDASTRETQFFREWCESRNPTHKHSAPFSVEMQNELEDFYLERYAMWFSQGLFGMANGQIPMVNIWDDHDIIDGFGSYPHHFMGTPVFTGVGAVSFKYYMLFQHHSVPDETEKEEPSWLLGAAPGPYVEELSRSLFMFLGRRVAFLGLDCRTERMKDEILSQATYDLVFERLRREIVKGDTQHLIVLLGVPIAYPRLNFLENVLTSRAMDPIKALGRLGLFGGFLNKFDGGVEILDDLDDHWTAKHHKHERNWLVQELQELAAEKSVRITILGGDVHLAAVGQFYSNKKLGIPKDEDHRYMPNIISSAIVNTPPPELMGDILNKRNKIHHLDHDTDEDLIPLFTHDVDGKSRNNHHLLPRRNWCAIREYAPGQTPPPTPPPQTPSVASEVPRRRNSLTRTLSLGRKDFTEGITRRLSRRGAGDKPPPRSFFNTGTAAQPANPRRASDPAISQPTENASSYFTGIRPGSASDPHPRPNPFHRIPTGLSEKAALRGAGADLALDQHINLQHGLDIILNLEVSQHDPAGITTPYRLLVPTLRYEGEGEIYEKPRRASLGRWLSTRLRGRGAANRDMAYDSAYESEGDMTPGPRPSGQYAAQSQQYAGGAPQAVAGAGRPLSYARDGVADGAASATAPLPPHAQGQMQAPAATRPVQGQPVPSGGEPGIGVDGRPVRNRYRGDLYGEADSPVFARNGPGGMAEDEDSDGEVVRQRVMKPGRFGVGPYGANGFEAGGKKKAGWKIWR